MTGYIMDIQRWSLNDGPGIRTVVFLKGCPLACVWCCNPESQRPKPDLGFFSNLCINCGLCIEDCPWGAISNNSEHIIIDRSICYQNCYTEEITSFPCSTRCYSEALQTIGRQVTTEEVVREVLKDEIIYQQTGGGVTLSGGEPLMQSDFAFDLIRAFQRERVNVGIETAGAAPWKDAKKVLSQVDFIYYDLKEIDPENHKVITKSSNHRILSNIALVSELCEARNIPLRIRIPLIPRKNDSLDSIELFIKFIKENVHNYELIELMPYHRLGRGKYEAIGRTNQTYSLELAPLEQLEEVRRKMSKAGLRNVILRGEDVHEKPY